MTAPDTTVIVGRFAAAVTGRRCWAPAALLIAVGVAVLMAVGANTAGEQSPQLVPAGADAARAAAAGAAFDDGARAPVLLVVTRTDGAALTEADRAATAAAADRMRAALPDPATSGAPPMISADRRAAVAPVPVSTALSGFDLDDTVAALRDAARAGLPGGLRAAVTGGPAFGADIADAFTGANVTLLAVTAAVVAVLLIVTYRSPLLWLVPLAVIGFADRVATAVGTAVASATGLSFDGSTAGITSVLVFGAGTNYALLLISRYRHELRRHREHRVALAAAVRTAGPAIVASNATVVAALLTLLLAVIPSTRSLGALAACALVVAAVAVLVVLPASLALCGRRLFWPFIPQPGTDSDLDDGLWHRVGAAVAARPALVAAGATAVLLALAGGLVGLRTGLSQTQQFRVDAESVTGFDTLAGHYPPGLVAPTVVIAATARDAAVHEAIDATAGVVSATATGVSAGGLTRWSVVTDAAPASDAAFATIRALRSATAAADPAALVGGPDAEALDVRDASVHDRRVVIPAILAVIVAVLFVLLRAVAAPPVLLAATVLSALAALGVGGVAALHLFGLPALDDSTPLYAFLFLAALGVDYTIFLVVRAREETAGRDTATGMIRAVSATGAVITSAGVVLAAVFAVLGVLPLMVLTQLGIIVGVGILLDTFVVRTLVIPAMFVLIGDRIWWPQRPWAAGRAGAGPNRRQP
ncbi:MMPL family transporter [Mycolicibacillus parakoreensis]|uniref:MMPL family transporter n=1 Tax=Mycolicibacillus parakoreensis TaxID=1069221 RepID=A0ABY3TZQ9_9MYCO|nr:MMPL family transporter [Mycolicibacillus parakoreensis]MCV7316001.1 MMPL family transporter [Mycolicibacillus parakoreensis]ULN52369.1 MMPL family transporter [Mycolicibacillus parakoreensis]